MIKVDQEAYQEMYGNIEVQSVGAHLCSCACNCSCHCNCGCKCGYNDLEPESFKSDGGSE